MQRLPAETVRPGGSGPINGAALLVNNVMNHGAAQMQRQNTNQRKQAMSEIESGITKILIATKQLLECLTQWSRKEATEQDVSDVYVSLGNEFNRATISFQNAGIAMADLESTPNDLRNILERALGEDASVANLEKFLPRIREIIINLLQGLKRKQQIHRVQNGEAAGPVRMRRGESQGRQTNPGMRLAEGNTTYPRSISNDSQRTASPRPVVGNDAPIVAGRQLPVTPMDSADLSNIQSPRKAPEPPKQTEPYSPAPAIPATGDPVSQLSQINLERRSSKRFSENYLAQLTSSPSADRHKLSVDGVRKNIQKTVSIPEVIEDEAPEYSAAKAYNSTSSQTSDANSTRSPPRMQPMHKTIASPRLRQYHNEDHDSVGVIENGTSSSTTSPPGPFDIFCTSTESTRKLTVPVGTTVSSLKKLVSAEMKLEDTIVLYIEDPASKISYELQEDKDIRALAHIFARHGKMSSAVQAVDGTPATNGFDHMRTWLEERLTGISSEIQEIRSSVVNLGNGRLNTTETPRLDSTSETDVTPSKASLESDTVFKTTQVAAEAGAVVSDNNEDHNKDHIKVSDRADHERTKELNVELQRKVDLLEIALEEAKSASYIEGVSANRSAVMAMSAKHEHRGTELTSKLEEAMNTMERIRKDVLQRKVTPRPQQLQDLSKEFEQVALEADALAANLVILDAASNKLWEEELTVITTEQETLEYQRMFIDDIKTDLEQSLSSLTTIKQVEEQKRLTPSSAVPVIVETAADPTRAIKFVQADIKSLQVNHERRAAAIADAERQRSKEREYLIENEFKQELGSFVGSNALKNTGGAAEMDRLREEKDQEHRRLLFSPPATPRDESPQEKEASEVEAEAPASIGTPPPLPTSREASPSKTVSSASVLAKIDASMTTDNAGWRRSLIPPISATPPPTTLAGDIEDE